MCELFRASITRDKSSPIFELLVPKTALFCSFRRLVGLVIQSLPRNVYWYYLLLPSTGSIFQVEVENSNPLL